MKSIAHIEAECTLLETFQALLWRFRGVFKQRRVFQRLVLLLIAEVLSFGRHTVTQLLMTLGWVERDWSAWYRLFRRQRFPYLALVRQLVEVYLESVEGEWLVVAGDGTTTPRSSRKIEGVGWLPHPQTAPFAKGMGLLQRWFHLAWLTPAQKGYSRALPLLWLPAFTPKSHRQISRSRSEVKAALVALRWLRLVLHAVGRSQLWVLMVGDGRYDNTGLWRRLPQKVVVLARSAANRCLYFLPTPEMRANRKYGKRAPTPREVWRQRTGWHKITLEVRGRLRHVQYKLIGPVVRYGVPEQPLFLIVVRGKRKGNKWREPLPFLVNAIQNGAGEWILPLPVEELLFWAWQRWELEVTHRELKSLFGLGEKQCWNPEGAILSVQWSAWAYAVLVLAAYRAWGLTGGPRPPTRWWRGGGRWSLHNLWRTYRALWWGHHRFEPVTLEHVLTAGDLSWLGPPLGNAAFGSARL